MCRGEIYKSYAELLEKKINGDQYLNKIKDIILNHYRNHSETSKNVCHHPGCGKMYIEKKNLNSHYKKHHKDLEVKFGIPDLTILTDVIKSEKLRSAPKKIKSKKTKEINKTLSVNDPLRVTRELLERLPKYKVIQISTQSGGKQWYLFNLQRIRFDCGKHFNHTKC